MIQGRAGSVQQSRAAKSRNPCYSCHLSDEHTRDPLRAHEIFGDISATYEPDTEPTV